MQTSDATTSSSTSISRELEILQKINALSKRINSTLELSQIIKSTIEGLPDLLRADKCSIFLFDPDAEELWLAAHNHGDMDTGVEIHISIHSNQLIARAVQAGRSILITDIEKQFGLKNRQKYKSKSSMITILKSSDQLLGIINISDKSDGSDFTEWDFSIAMNINEHLGTAISNAQLFAQTRRLSITDGLTDLYTHRFFQETLTREIIRAKRYKKPLSLLMLDIDFFKRVNDTFGHQAGDCVLQGLARTMIAHLRRSDFACRYGGEEFGVILTETDLMSAMISAERLRTAAENLTIPFAGRDIRFTVSIGVSGLAEGLEKSDMIEMADRALYQAKRDGRNRSIASDLDEYLATRQKPSVP